MSLTVLNRYTKCSHTYISYICDVCGYNGEMRESHYKNGIGCSVCNGKNVMKGFNDVATQRPDLVKYFVNHDEAYNITPFSHKFVHMKCPLCGYSSHKRMSDVSRRGFKCNICYGGFSYPSRFISALLYASSVKFETEKMFKWSGKRRYDFYLPEHRLLIEVNGVQHYKQTTYSADLSETIRIDDEKLSLAIINGYNFECIDARESNFQWLKMAVELSNLPKYIDIENTNWDKIKIMSEAEIGSNIIKIWNQGYRSTKEIGEKLNISQSTVGKYLKIYRDMGVCDYDELKQRLICQRKASSSRRKRVMCINTGEQFDSLKDASKHCGIHYNAIQNCLVGRSKSAGRDKNGNKLKWTYL